MTRLTPVLVLFASLALLPAQLHADPLGPFHLMGRGGSMLGDSGGMMLPLLLKHVHLTPEQTKQVQAIMDGDRQNLRSLLTQLQTANDQLASKLFAPGNLQPADLAPQIQTVNQLRQQLMEHGLKTALAIRAVLTPEQLTKAAQLKDRLQKVHAEMRSLLEGED